MTSDTILRHPLTRAAAASPGVVPADAGRRLLALLGEGSVTLAPLLVVPLLGVTRLPAGWAWTVGCLGVLGVAAALVGDLTRTGRTPMRRLLGLRTVATDDEFPPSLAELVGRRVLTADLRAGRDPLLLVPDRARPPLPVTRVVWPTPRPAATGSWRLQLDDGRQFAITRPTLVGRDPSVEDADGADRALIAIVDLTRSVSRVHALIEPGDDCLWLTDAGTTNGTRAASPSASGGTVIERWLPPGERTAVRAGGTIHLGDRVLRVTPSAGPAGADTSSRRTPGAPRGD